jgi:multidrug resistance protein MdtO
MCPPHAGFYQFLRHELRPGPDRIRAVLRVALACSTTVVLAMVFQVPLPAYMAYVVLLISRDEVAGTIATALGGLAAASLAVTLSLLFYIVDASEPALRIVLLAASTFAGIFVARTFALGPIVFLGAFILVLSQTLLDDVPSPEAMTHFLLWLWMVVAIPVVVTVAVNLALGVSPVVALQGRIRAFASELGAHIGGGAPGGFGQCGESLAEAMSLLPRAQSWSAGLKAYDKADRLILGTLAEILVLTRLLPAGTNRERQRLAAMLRTSITRWVGGAPVPDDRPTASTGQTTPTECALADALVELDGQVTQRAAEVPAAHRATHKRRWVPDAFTNRGHVHFALKVTAAVVAAYVTYTLLAWPGIRTAVTTCFFVALSSLGETMHKLTLRLSGALIGGLAAGLCIVFVIPLLTDIGQLAVLVAVAAMACGWVASSSERIAYAGLQMAFAFFLGVLQDYGPPTDLTVLRDRMVGIFVGNIWMSIVFGALWPVTTASLMRSSVASALRAVAKVVTRAPETLGAGKATVALALIGAERLAPLSWFEWKFSASVRASVEAARLTISAAERLAASAFVLVREEPASSNAPGASDPDAAWLVSAASHLVTGGAAGPVATVQTDDAANATDPRVRLHEEMRHAAPHF